MADIIDAIYRSGISGKIKLTQAGQEGYAPLGFAFIQTFPDADQICVAKATGAAAGNVVKFDLVTGILTAETGSPVLEDADGKNVNGETVAADIVYCYGYRKFLAGALTEEAMNYKAGDWEPAPGQSLEVGLTTGESVIFFLIGKSAA